MKKLKVGTLAAVTLSAWMTPLTAKAESAEEGLAALFQHYTEVWNAGNLPAIGNQVYQPPITIVETGGSLRLDTADDIVALLAPMRAELDRAGFSHSELRGVSVCDLGGGLAFASYHYSRFDKQGDSMGDPVQASAYIARRTQQGWRLVAHVMQSEVSDIECRAP